MANNPTSPTRVDANELRKIFNDQRISERGSIGELQVVVLEDRHPSLPLAQEPYCTRSQMVSYRDGTQEIARAHLYLRMDGSIGLSGKPDPKRVVFNGVMYSLYKKQQNTQ